MQQDRKARAERNKGKADGLVAWFNATPPPPGPINLHPWAVVTDPVQYVETQKEIISHADPLCRAFYLAAMRLWELKKHMTDESIEKSNP